MKHIFCWEDRVKLQFKVLKHCGYHWQFHAEKFLRHICDNMQFLWRRILSKLWIIVSTNKNLSFEIYFVFACHAKFRYAGKKCFGTFCLDDTQPTDEASEIPPLGQPAISADWKVTIQNCSRKSWATFTISRNSGFNQSCKKNLAAQPKFKLQTI